jgi:hypothetical protein
VSYRTQATRDPSPPREEVVDLTRFSRAYVVVLLAVTVVALVVAAGSYGSTSVVCDRRERSAAPTCELVESRLLFPSHERLDAGAGAVEVKEASLNDDGKKPYLAVHTPTSSLHWFDLGARNEELASAYQRYRASSEPHLSLRVERNAVFAGTSLTIAISCGLPLLFATRRRRVVIDLDTGVVRVGSTARYETEGFDRVSVESSDGDSDLDHVVLCVGKNRHVLGSATTLLAVASAKRLDALLRQVWEDKKKAAFSIPPEA